jgi:hypothetical protein
MLSINFGGQLKSHLIVKTQAIAGARASPGFFHQAHRNFAAAPQFPSMVDFRR